jgi:hypothetical protein
VVLSITAWELALWAGISSVTVLASAEIVSPYYGVSGILLDSKRMRIIGFALALAFFVLVAFFLSAKIR